MNVHALIDPASAAIVIGGTLIATALRSGRREWAATAAALGALARPRFSYERARAELAGQVEDIRHDGVLRARPEPSADAEIAEATGALIRHRSLGALMAAHDRHRARRERAQAGALDLMMQAGELAPVFGLAGTLVALSQLTADGLDRGGLMGAVATAVLTTLYGLLTAHLVIFPLARQVERRGLAEEAERQRLVEWLADQLRDALPGTGAQAADRRGADLPATAGHALPVRFAPDPQIPAHADPAGRAA